MDKLLAKKAFGYWLNRLRFWRLDRVKYRVLGVFQSNDEPRLFPIRFGPTFRPSFLFPAAGGAHPNKLLDRLGVGHRARPSPESTRKIQHYHSRKRSAGPAVQASSIQTP